MDFRKLTILPAALALSLFVANLAHAGEDGGPPKNDGEEHNQPPEHNPPPEPNNPPPEPDNEPTPPQKVPTPTPPSRSDHPTRGGGSNSNDYGSNIVCRIGNRTVYLSSYRQCNELKYALGYGVKVRGGGQVVVQGGGQYQGGYATGGYATGGYGYYQPQRVIRYVAMPSRAAQMQAERRARKAARRAVQANGYGYGDGGMVGYGNGVMVGGYGNNVVVNGSVYAGNGYANQRVVVKKRHGRKGRRVMMYQQPAYAPQPGMIYGGDYGYDGPVMYKGGGY